MASDFSLIDAIESGIVKVPRVPVDDNQMSGTLPTYRALWEKIRKDLPRKGRATQAVTGDPVMPVEFEGAITSLYENYAKYHEQWEATARRCWCRVSCRCSATSSTDVGPLGPRRSSSIALSSSRAKR